MTKNDVGTLVERALAVRIGEDRYRLWFQQRAKFSFDDDGLKVGVPNRICQEYLQTKYGKEVAAAAREIVGETVTVRFVIDGELFRASRKAETQDTAIPEPVPQLKTTAGPANGRGKKPTSPTNVEVAPKQKNSRKRRWRKLKDFVVGPCNRVAHASALAVAEMPGLDVNPLVLHGPVGTGKTHLLEGIYLDLRKGNPDWRILFVTAEDFTNRFVQAMRLGKLSSFRKYFRDCDALLMDDVHFLASKRATQEEFLHTFDVLENDGLQVVVTCDCHPRLNDQFMPELADRLLGGAVWGITPPDYDTRLNLLRAKSQRNGEAPLSEEVLSFLAEQLRGNVRELEGAINSLRHFGRVAARKVDVNMAREVLGDLIQHNIRIVQMPDIDEAVCRLLKMASGSLQGKQRAWAVSHPRMIAMYLARKHTSASYTEVGKHFGNRSHSTVVAAEKKVRQWLEDDHQLNLGKQQMRVRDIIERVERELSQ